MSRQFAILAAVFLSVAAVAVALAPLMAQQLVTKEKPSDKTAGDGNVYYVSPDGRGDGTDPAKAGTIAGILPMLRGGDVMLLLSGEYLVPATREGKSPPIIDINKYFRFASAPTKDKPIRIAAARGHKPVLKGDGKGWGILCDSRHSHNMIIEGLVLQNFWQAGIRVGYDVPQENITIRGCDVSGIHCNDNMGGVFIHGSSVTVEHCVFHDFFYSRNGREHQGLGMVIFRGRDLTIRNNEFRNLHGGLYYKHGEPKLGTGGFTHITGNLFHHIQGFGAATNQNRTEFTNNVFDGCGLSVHNEDGTVADFTFDVKIHNNTFVDSELLFPWQHGDFSGPKNFSVKQNILYRSAYAVWRYGSDELFEKGVGLVSDDNCYWYPGKEQVVEYFSSSNPAFNGVKMGGAYKLNEWKKLGYDTNSIEANPLFLDLEKGNYGLRKETKCPAMGAFPLETKRGQE